MSNPEHGFQYQAESDEQCDPRAYAQKPRINGQYKKDESHRVALMVCHWHLHRISKQAGLSFHFLLEPRFRERRKNVVINA